MGDSYEQEERSHKFAHDFRAMLTALATVGAAAAYIVGNHYPRNDLWRAAAFHFVIALLCAIASSYLVRHRKLKRRECSWWLDGIGAVYFGVGVVLLAGTFM